MSRTGLLRTRVWLTRAWLTVALLLGTLPVPAPAQAQDLRDLHLNALPGRDGPLVIVECAIEEDPRIVLIALDDSGVTNGALPGQPLQLGFGPDEGGTRFAVVLPAEGPR